MNPLGKAMHGSLLLTGLAASLAQPAAAQKTYIAVGDSLAYGFKSPNPTPNQTTPGGPGFPGYTAAYANYLSAQSGTTYSVLNLGIVGETSGALTRTTISDGTPDSALNSHYGSSATQTGLLIQDITAAGGSLGVITIQIGANDVLQALSSSPDPATALANAQIAINQVGLNDAALLTQIRAARGGGPLSNVILMGYYDPYAGLSASSPYAYLRTISPGLTTGLNSVIALEAQTFGARYVDLSTPFSAHLANYDDYTLANSSADALNTLGFTGLPNDHPTDLGYALIAQTLAAPEPSAAAPFCLGALGLTGLALRARRRRA